MTCSPGGPPVGIEATSYGATRAEHIVYRLPHPAPDGSTALSLSPLEFLERLALLIFTLHAFTVTAITGYRPPGYRPKVGPLQVIALGRETSC